MKIVTAHYQDLTHALDTIDLSRVPDPENPTQWLWASFADTIPGAHDQSFKGKGKERGEPLERYSTYCRNYSAPYLAKRAESIAALSEQVQGTGLQAASMKRHQIWTRQGSRINPHRVLRGQLSTAWRKTVREHRSSTMGRIAIVLNIAVSYNIPTEQILWSTAATLALAEIARKAGRSIDIYAVGYGHNVYEDLSHVLCFPLMLSHQVWSIHNTTLMTSNATFRRFCFRLWEIDQVKYGPIGFCYGWPGSASQIRAWADTELSAHINLPSEAIHIGCTQADRVNSMESAKYWLENIILSVDAA